MAAAAPPVTDRPVRQGRSSACSSSRCRPSPNSPHLHRDDGFPVSASIYAGLLILGGLGGFISWLVTRWRIAEGNLQIETGFIRRQSLRIPLARIQAVDVISPLSGRFLGLAEVRVVSAGRGAEHGRLAYLTAAQAPVVRARLLALAHGLEVAPPSLWRCRCCTFRTDCCFPRC